MDCQLKQNLSTQHDDCITNHHEQVKDEFNIDL